MSLRGSSIAIAAAAAVAAATLLGCHDGSGWSGNIPAADALNFQSAVYPVLMRDCAFSECHGAPQRFFQVFGPGRTRLDPATKTDDPPTADELQVSYERALSMLATEGSGGVGDSRLLRKPLAIVAGGIGHLGVDDFGRNVFASKLSPGYVAIRQWAEGAQGVVAAAPQAGAGGAP